MHNDQYPNSKYLEQFLGDVGLSCPRARATQQPTEALHFDGGALVCREGCVYPLREGVPDLRPFFSEFGAKHYDDIHSNFVLNDAIDFEKWTKLFALSEEVVRGKTVLVAGAGVGTELFCILRLKPAFVVALDYSDTIRRFQELLPPGCHCLLLQADILHPPFREETFDLVFNSGVMHHLRSPELGFRSLYSCLKRGGMISIGSLYLNNFKYRMVSIGRLRHEFHKKPYAEVKNFFVTAVKRRRLLRRLGLDGYYMKYVDRLFIPNYGTSFEMGLRASLDFYYPEYRHLFEEEEVLQWFKEIGARDVTKLERQFIGRRP